MGQVIQCPEDSVESEQSFPVAEIHDTVSILRYRPVLVGCHIILLVELAYNWSKLLGITYSIQERQAEYKGYESYLFHNGDKNTDFS